MKQIIAPSSGGYKSRMSKFFCFTYFVFCVFVSLTAVRISRSVYFFTQRYFAYSLNRPIRKKYLAVTRATRGFAFEAQVGYC